MGRRSHPMKTSRKWTAVFTVSYFPIYFSRLITDATLKRKLNKTNPNFWHYKRVSTRGLSRFRPARFMSTLFMSTDSCPSDSCQALFMSDPIHVRLDRFMSGLIHARTYSCQALFMSDLIHVQKDRFMSGPFHVWPHSCPSYIWHISKDRFMSGPSHVNPIHVLQYLFMYDPIQARPDSCPRWGH